MDIVSATAAATNVIEQSHVGNSADRVSCPRALGERIAALYQSWEERGLADLGSIARVHLNRLGILDDAPVARACLRTAQAVTEWGGHPYHSVLHHAEVATNAMILSTLDGSLGHPVEPCEAVLLLLAALAHDLGHDGTCNDRVPFRLEAASAAALDGICADSGVPDGDRASLRALVLATEPEFRALVASLASVGDGGVPPKAEVPDELSLLAEEPRLAHLAAILSDADLLSSAGLTKGWNAVQCRRLGDEIGRTIDASRQRCFLEDIVGPGFISRPGRIFDGNLERIRAAVGA